MALAVAVVAVSVAVAPRLTGQQTVCQVGVQVARVVREAAHLLQVVAVAEAVAEDVAQPRVLLGALVDAPLRDASRNVQNVKNSSSNQRRPLVACRFRAGTATPRFVSVPVRLWQTLPTRSIATQRRW